MTAIDGQSLDFEKFKKIVVEGDSVTLSEDAKKNIKKGRKVVDRVIESGERVYSINTGFGVLSNVAIPAESLEKLQENLIRSHCAGVGEPHTERESRAILLLRANVLARGMSGCRLELVELLLEMLNRRVHPVIPSKGSVGASGDLAPLAHLASVVIGEGEAFFEGKQMHGAEAMQRASLTPIKLAPKEGLSLINGTQQMTGLGALLVLQAEELLDIADLVSSCSLEVVLGSTGPFAAWIQDSRPYNGQKQTAKNLLSFMDGSQIAASHQNCDRVQDPYSFRCVPQVHGACREMVQFVRNIISVELNAVTDNPIINLETGEITSNGNFHGQPVAFALDALCMAMSEVASISERRIAKLIDPQFSELPTFLVENPGLNSGLMMNHVTAAALVSENRLLSHPASTDSIPTNVEKEDHVSMGPLCARKAKSIIENSMTVIAIEALAACQGLEFRLPLLPGRGPQFLYKFVRQQVKALENDRYLQHDIEWICNQLRTGEMHRQLQKQKWT